jgi:transcription initiation factor TFIIIB Brf1 subunit/transcription initiation factor TFIIB
MKCTNCGSNNSIKDSGRGDTVCGDCGKVLEESEVVCDVAFENTKVVGSFVTDQIGGFSFTKNRHGNLMLESSEIRRSKAYSEIQKLASNLCKNIFLILSDKSLYG